MELFLVQHAESKTELEDPDRPLTEAGAAVARQMAVWAARARVSVNEIRHSGKTRAAQTAAILGGRLAPKAGVHEMAGINPLDDPMPLADELSGRERSLMLVGHLPYLGRLAGLLLANDAARQAVQFEYAGIACLRRQEEGWSLSWAMLPRLLGP